MNRQRSIGPVGTLARIIVGGGLIALALWNPEPWNGRGFEWYDPVLGLIAFPAVILAAQWLRTRFATEVLEATQPIAYCLNIALGALLVRGGIHSRCLSAFLRHGHATGCVPRLRRLRGPLYLELAPAPRRPSWLPPLLAVR